MILTIVIIIIVLNKFDEEDDYKDDKKHEEWKVEEDIYKVKSKHRDFENEHPAKDISNEKLYKSTNDQINNHNNSIGEVIVHQLIETIEFVLGTISNTASYLRLWALSLAHSQLAGVFYDKIMGYWVDTSNSFLLFLTFPLFATATFGVLMWMDSMEWFLHTLRLHWVEFQNKFYKGSGYKFNKFWFEQELDLIN